MTIKLGYKVAPNAATLPVSTNDLLFIKENGQVSVAIGQYAYPIIVTRGNLPQGGYRSIKTYLESQGYRVIID
jgi:hypothetical protein